MYLLKKILPTRATLSRILDVSSGITRNIGSKTPKKSLIVESLPGRELLRLEGEEVVPFLQGLITNDMNRLRAGLESETYLPSMYTMFLNKAGRVLYDTIIYSTPEPNTFLIECDTSVSNELRRHMRLYRVKRQIDIESLNGKYTVWVAFNPDASGGVNVSRLTPTILSSVDPRLRELGVRLITTPDRTWLDLAKLLTNPGDVTVASATKNCNYRIHRYRCGVAEGSQDLPPGKNFPLEANLAYLSGISFHKGCYIGQELTARTHHTGVIRKRVVPIRLSKTLEGKEFEIQTPSGNKVGTVLGSSDCRAIGLLRLEQGFNSPELLIDGDPCFPEKPQWWSQEVPKTSLINEAP